VDPVERKRRNNEDGKRGKGVLTRRGASMKGWAEKRINKKREDGELKKRTKLSPNKRQLAVSPPWTTKKKKRCPHRFHGERNIPSIKEKKREVRRARKKRKKKTSK